MQTNLFDMIINSAIHRMHCITMIHTVYCTVYYIFYVTIMEAISYVDVCGTFCIIIHHFYYGVSGWNGVQHSPLGMEHNFGSAQETKIHQCCEEFQLCRLAIVQRRSNSNCKLPIILILMSHVTVCITYTVWRGLGLTINCIIIINPRRTCVAGLQ